jgi:hypothetical protein
VTTDPDLARTAQLLQGANELSQHELASIAGYKLRMMRLNGAPQNPNEAAVMEAAARFVALTTGERPI